MEKKPSRHFFRILAILFLVFIALYIAMESGYYEAKLGEKTTLTNDKIEQFEQDIKDGKPVDVDDYLDEPMEDYSNKISKASVGLTSGTEKFLTSGISRIFEFIGVLFS